MAEYIEREAAIDAIMKVYVRTAGYKARERVFEAKEAVHRLPVADVAPVLHGRFVHDGQLYVGGIDWFHCSSCGRLVAGAEERFDYCPWCGARMGGDSDALD